MPVRGFKFFRGRSKSEEMASAISGPENVGEKKKKRAGTYPDSEPPGGDRALQAIQNFPEPHFDLFEKLCQKPAVDFPNFPRLPPKIRLIIIRLLFDRDREVRLRVQYRDGEYKLKDFGFPVPATFFVNREFRNETLKNYYFFSQIEAFETASITGVPTSPHCYCLNPKLDRVSVGFQSLWTHNYSLFLKSAFREVPECMRAIRELDIVNIFQANFALMRGKEALLEKFLRDNLARFHYLEKIRLVIENTEAIDTNFVKYLAEEITQAFEAERRRWPYCSIPNIIFVLPPAQASPAITI